MAALVYTAEVKISGFLFQNHTYDLCNTAMHHIGLKCPVPAAGKYSVNMTAPIPVITLRVSARLVYTFNYVTYARAFTQACSYTYSIAEKFHFLYCSGEHNGWQN